MTEYLIENLKGRTVIVRGPLGIPVLEVQDAQYVEIDKFAGTLSDSTRLFTNRVTIIDSKRKKHKYDPVSSRHS